MRKVMVFKWIKDGNTMKMVSDGEATFHQWGCDFVEFENGPGNFSTAIIERENGLVQNVRADLVQFID